MNEPTIQYEFCRSYPPMFVEREGKKVTRYAISTDAYLPIDGWSLRSAGMKLIGPRLPLMWEHGIRASYTHPIGYWDNLKIEGREIVGEPVIDEEIHGAKDTKRGVDMGVLFASVRYKILDGREATREEREALGVPRNFRSAMIATEWIGQEGSLVVVPLNHEAGQRSDIGCLFPADMLGNIDGDKRAAHVEAALARLLAPISTTLEHLQREIVALRSQNATTTQKTDTACGVAVSTDSHTALAQGRDHYISQLGMNLDDALSRIKTARASSVSK